MMIAERLVAGGEHLLGDRLARGQIVRAVGQYLRLDDGHNAVLLTDGRVACQHVGVLDDGQLGGQAVADLERTAPLGEVGAELLVGGAARVQVVEALGGGLAVGAGERHEAAVDLDARYDAARLEQLREWRAVVRLLVEGLVEEDHARHVVGYARVRGEEELTIEAAVLLGVLDVDAVEALGHAARRLVGRKDALARRHDGVRNASKLGLFLSCQVRHFVCLFL